MFTEGTLSCCLPHQLVCFGAKSHARRCGRCAFLAALTRPLPARGDGFIVTPQTLSRWHRD